ncbi:MAG TPA: hypothetical protein VD905_00640 [Flavobacteriales bacterium]|nr:hypothetical protein [Flavobacteriales bacterium]
MKRILTLSLFLFSQIILAQTYKVGDAVSIEWKGKWYPGKILEVQKDGYKISYDGYGADWNETVTSGRVKSAGAATTNRTTKTENTAINSGSFATIGEASFNGIETINDLDLGSNGKMLVGANSHGKITVLNPDDLTLITEIKLFRGETSPVGTVAINNACTYIAAADGNGKVYVYNKSTAGEWTEYATIETYSMVNKLKFSPVSNDLCIAAAPKTDYRNVVVDIWNADEKKVKKTLLVSTNANHSIGGISFTTDGSKVAFAISNAKKGIEIYETATGKLVSRIDHKFDVVGLAFSPDGTTMAAGGTDKNITLWNLATKKPVWTSEWHTGLDAYVFSVAFAPDGKTVAASGAGTGCKIRVYDASTGKLKSELGKSNPGGNAVCYAANSKVVYTGLTVYGDFAKVPMVYMAAIPQE